MALKKPLVVSDTAGVDLEQIQSGDSMDFGSFSIPEAIGTEGQVLAVPAAGTVLEWQDKDGDISKLSLTNGNIADAPICTPVYISSADTFDLAQADASTTAHVFGLASALIEDGEAGLVQYEGVLAATTGEWDAVTGDSGGLTAGAVYYLSEVTAGLLTTTKPTTGVVVSVGQAISTTRMRIKIGSTILL